MRRALVLALLLAGVRLILPLGAQGQGGEVLVAFGLLILGAYTVGEIASAARLPKIVGYLVAGLIFGPSVLGAVSAQSVQRLQPVSQLAVSVIAFLAGAELRWRDVRVDGPALLKIMATELAVGFVALFGTIVALRGSLPLLANEPPAGVLAFALLFASIAIVHSPAVTLALLTETGARGPVARTVLGVVLLADVAVVLLFSATLPIARALVPPVAAPQGVSVFWEIGGAILIGAILGGGVASYLRFIGKELVLFAVLVAFFGVQIAELAHVELLLTMLTAGFVTENLSRRGDELRHAMERSAAPIFVVFFALSGAHIEVASVVPLLPFVLPIAAVRAAAIWVGTRIGAGWAGTPPPVRRVVWMGLISQAGVAIGLASVVATAYGEAGRRLQVLLLSLIAVNETIGPVLFRRALQAGGELTPEGRRVRGRAVAAH